MIKITLDIELARQKRTLKVLAQQVGITQANLSMLKTGKKKVIRFETLDKICKELNCQPGDIFQYIGDDEASD